MFASSAYIHVTAPSSAVYRVHYSLHYSGLYYSLRVNDFLIKTAKIDFYSYDKYGIIAIYNKASWMSVAAIGALNYGSLPRIKLIIKKKKNKSPKLKIYTLVNNIRNNIKNTYNNI